ncbi:hypothetical protein IJ707_06335, partial [bacterium]|nr:hypothetical protein [bacterium]
QRLYTKEDQAASLNGVVDNVDLADSPEMQVSVVNAAAQAAKAAGISAEVGESIGNAIVANKFHGREATIEALRTQYGLNAEQANKYYANLPEETRQQIEDETLDAITSVQTEVAADSSQPEDVRHNAADLAAEYATYIDDAEYQMQVIQNNMDYIMQNADADMQEYYSTSVANNAYNYDLSNREDVIRMLKEQGFEKTMTALENAKAEYEAKDAENKAATEALKTIQENQQQAQTQDTQDNKKTTSTQQNRQVVSRPTVTPSVNVPQSNVTMPQQTSVPRTGMFGLSSVQTYIMSSEFKSADIKTKEEYISKLNASDKQQAIGTLIENSQDYELQRLMLSSLKKDVLKYLVNHPNPKNNESLTYLKGFLSGADLEYVKELKEERREKMGIRETVSTSPTSTDATAFKRSPFNFEA